MNWVADYLFLLLNTLFAQYGAIIVFAAALTEATVGLGVFVPGIVMIFLAGAYAREQGESLLFLFMVADIGITKERETAVSEIKAALMSLGSIVKRKGTLAPTVSVILTVPA